jgi:hypothetical protein
MQNYRNSHKNGKRGKASAIPSAHRAGSLYLALPAICLLIGAGCAGGPTGGGADPLVGEVHPQKPSPYGPTPTSPVNTTPAKSSWANYDPLYGSAGLTPNADSRPSLKIPENSGSNNPAFTAGYTTTGGAPTVTPLSEPGSHAPGSFVPGTATTEILQAQLRSRGVIWQKQEPVADGVRFTCIVPNRYNPDSCRAYDATARDLLTAVQAVLVQIDRP